MSTEYIKIEVSGGFIIMLALLYYFLGLGMLAALLAAALFHELGHISALKIMGGKIEKICFGAVGAYIGPAVTIDSYLKTAMASFAGPAAGIILYFLLLSVNKDYANASLLLSVLNLLPISGLDGGNVLFNLCSHFFGVGISDRMLSVTSCLTIFLIFLASFVTFNFMLCLTAVWLLIDFTKDIL